MLRQRSPCCSEAVIRRDKMLIYLSDSLTLVARYNKDEARGWLLRGLLRDKTQHDSF